MNTQLIELGTPPRKSRAAGTPLEVSATAARPRSRRVQSPRPSTQIVYRQATPAEAPAIYRLIATHLAEGRLLPRDIAELTVHAHRFVVAVRGGHIAGCAELAPLSGRVAEIRSLVVDRAARSLGIGRRLIEELHRRARVEGFEQLCAFAHDAAYFVRLGFSIVPHTWVPEKIARDCTSCAQFRRCGQHAVVRPVHGSRRGGGGSFVPLSALRG